MAEKAIAALGFVVKPSFVHPRSQLPIEECHDLFKSRRVEVGPARASEPQHVYASDLKLLPERLENREVSNCAGRITRYQQQSPSFLAISSLLGDFQRMDVQLRSIILAEKLICAISISNLNVINDEFTSFQARSLGHAVGHGFKKTRLAHPNPLVFQLSDHCLIV